MEGYKREFETESHEEEHERHELDEAAVESGGDVLEIEGSRGSVYQGYTVERQSGSEHGGKNVFRACLGGFLLVLVERGEASHRDGCRFQSDEEHQEVAGGDHEIHTQ